MRLPALMRTVLVGLGLGLALGASGAGCFHPREPPCAFTCVSPGARCPTDYTCGADGLCHRDGAEGICTLNPPDGGPGGGTAGAGGASEGAGGSAGAAAGGGAAGAGGTSGGPGGVAGAGA